MDMSNAAIGGPSRGLLDILFGSSEEKEPADGSDFSSVAALVKALSGEGNEEDGELFKGRTEEGTKAGQDSSDSRSNIPPVFLPSALMLGNLQQLQAANGSGATQEALATVGNAKGNLKEMVVPFSPQAVLQDGERQLKQVNELLQSQGAATLSVEEQNLFRQVHGKMAALPADGNGLLNSLPAEGDPAAGVVAQAEKGTVVPDKVAVIPEKVGMFLPTQDYMRLRQDPSAAVAGEAPVKSSNSQIESKVIDLSAVGENLTGVAVAKKGADSSLENEEDQGKGSSSHGFNSHSNVEGAPGLGPKGAEFSMATEVKAETLTLSQKPQILQGIRDGIVTVNQQGGGEMKIILRPEHLGEIRLKVVTGKDGTVDISIQAENKEVADMIKGNAVDLEVALQDKNLVLSKVDVTVMDGVTATGDSKASSGDQFSGQNNQQNSQARGEQKNDSWREHRQSFSELGRENGLQTSPQKSSPRKQSYNAMGRDSAGRLDVVA
jgi:hypothetical protein